MSNIGYGRTTQELKLAVKKKIWTRMAGPTPFMTTILEKIAGWHVLHVGCGGMSHVPT